MKHRLELKWVLLLLLVSAIWGSTFVAMKDTLSFFGPFALMAIRFSMAAAVLGAYLLATRQKITNEETKYGTILGVFLLAGYGFQTMGLDYISAGASAFITNLYVLLVPVFSALLLQKMPKGKIWFAMAIALAGLYLMSGAGDGTGFNIGDALTLLCAFGWALQILYLSKYSPKCDPLRLAFVQIAFVAAASIALTFLSGEVPSSFPLPAMLTLAYLAIAATIFAQAAQAEGQKHLEPSKVALIFITEPLFAALFGFLLMGEIFTSQKLAGGALILLALFISEWEKIDF